MYLLPLHKRECNNYVAASLRPSVRRENTCPGFLAPMPCMKTNTYHQELSDAKTEVQTSRAMQCGVCCSHPPSPAPPPLPVLMATALVGKRLHFCPTCGHCHDVHHFSLLALLPSPQPPFTPFLPSSLPSLPCFPLSVTRATSTLALRIQ